MDEFIEYNNRCMRNYNYIRKIKERPFPKFFLGLVSRTLLYFKHECFRRYARLRGAVVGGNSILSWKLARRANKNLIIGEDCIVEAWDFDLRSKIEICDNVIINRDVVIIRVGHFIDDNRNFMTHYYPDLKIENYCWLCTGCKILPSVKTVSKGSVIGAYSVLTKDTNPMGVYAGNPAILRRTHNTMFDELVVSSLMGGDLTYYIKARMS